MSETNIILSDIRAYLRISAANAYKASAAKILDTYEKALVYSKLDGKTSRYKLEPATGVPEGTIKDWLEDFVEASFASAPNELNKSHKALFTLRELGIDLKTLGKRVEKGKKPNLETPQEASKETPSEEQQGTMEKFLEEEKNGTAKQ